MQRREFLKQMGGTTAVISQNWAAAAMVSAGGAEQAGGFGAGAGFTCAKLRCEYRTNPLGLGVRQPRLSWILAAANEKTRGLRQTAFQIIVASSEANLAANRGDLWDSGRINSDESLHIVYQGQALKSKQQCYWKVRSWDAAGHDSPWSMPAQWTMGLLDRADWQAHWIAGRETLGRQASLCYRGGYQSEVATSADTEKWVMLDLGQIATIDAVRLFPAAWQYNDYTPGYLFPLRFKIEAANELDFSQATTLVDQRQADVPDPVRWRKPTSSSQSPLDTCG